VGVDAQQRNNLGFQIIMMGIYSGIMQSYKNNPNIRGYFAFPLSRTHIYSRFISLFLNLFKSIVAWPPN